MSTRMPHALWMLCAVLSFAPVRARAHGDLHEQIRLISEQLRKEPQNAGLFLQRGGGPADAALARRAALGAIEALPPAKRKLESSQQLEQRLRLALAPHG